MHGRRDEKEYETNTKEDEIEYWDEDEEFRQQNEHWKFFIIDETLNDMEEIPETSQSL